MMHKPGCFFPSGGCSCGEEDRLWAKAAAEVSRTERNELAKKNRKLRKENAALRRAAEGMEDGDE